MIVSRPKTLMNHGTPAPGSLPMPVSSERIRSDARSETDCAKACESISQDVRTCGTFSCHADSESRTWPTSSPNRRSAKRGATSSPSGSGKIPTCSAQFSRGSSAILNVTVESLTSPRSEKITCVLSGNSLCVSSASRNWLRSGSKAAGWGGGSGSAFGSPREKSWSLTAKMSAKSDATCSASSNSRGRCAELWTTKVSCIAPSPTKRSRLIDSSSRSRSPASGLRVKNAAEKYSIRPDESSSGRFPLIVMFSPERNLVSSANNPSTSAWKSPSSSQMQNVEPSRMRNCSAIRSGLCAPPRIARVP